jgi:hypothetical protein
MNPKIIKKRLKHVWNILVCVIKKKLFPQFRPPFKKLRPHSGQLQTQIKNKKLDFRIKSPWLSPLIDIGESENRKISF